MPTRQQLIDEAREWIGTPWVHQARLKGIGVDCIGLVGVVALNCGVAGAREWMDDPEMHNYGRMPRPEFTIDACGRFLDRVPPGELLMGDVLQMAFRRYPQHYALVSTADGSHVIHAYQSIGRVVENGIKIANARIVAAYRFRGVE